ncbi:formimidoylglutamase [Thiotrichales bacterium 19S9-12]|nr:formimidoylglutamase [Thiotrichales bacterium 19S9-11]MCF6811493.1 formimidoylglutamase [Thiotrichales bacterium 19S9-12]
MYQKTKNLNLWQGMGDKDLVEYVYQNVLIGQIEDTFLKKGYGLLGFKSDEGVRRNLGRIGAREAPDSIRHSLSSLAVSKEIGIYDFGDILCLDGNLEASQALFSEQVVKIIKQGLLPVGLGGGHEIAWGHYLGIDKAYEMNEEVAIINFDAHLDLRTLVNGKDASSGTPFYQISEYLKQMNRPFHYYCLGVQPSANTKKLFEYAKAHHVTIQVAEDIKKDPFDLSLIKKIVNQHAKIYVTVCLDVFHASIAPGVSAPQALGVDAYYVLEALKYLKQSNQVVGIDVAELSPRFDIDGRSSKLAANLIHTFLMA